LSYVQGTSPIYNLLPDILSNLSKERSLSKAQFQAIMQHVRGQGRGRGSLVGCRPGGQGRTQAWGMEGQEAPQQQDVGPAGKECGRRLPSPPA